MNPAAAPIMSPRFTWAPTSTTALAGAPRCCTSGTFRIAGTGSVTSAGLQERSFFSGGWTPPPNIRVDLIVFINVEVA